TSLEIAPDSKIYDARLQIHQSDLQELRAALDAADRNTNIATAVTRSSTRTIIAGLLMFLSVSCAGVWLARSQGKSSARRTRKVIAAALIGAATIGAAAIITRGNAGPPGYYRWRTLPQALTQGRPTAGGLGVEILPDDPKSGSGRGLFFPSKNFGKPGEEKLSMQTAADLEIPWSPTKSRQSDSRTAAFVLSLAACTACSAVLASWLPLQVSVITVFLFAGPHNWFELRYFLMRVPARFGKSRTFFVTAFSGVGVLSLTYFSLPLLFRYWLWTQESWSIVIASWNSLLLCWLGLLVCFWVLQNPP